MLLRCHFVLCNVLDMGSYLNFEVSKKSVSLAEVNCYLQREGVKEM